MLFNSFPFIFVFLPLTWLAAMAAYRLAGMRLEQATICLASLVFYAMWDVRFLPVLLGSIGVNFWLGRRILHARVQPAAAAGRWLAAGVSFNLLVLGFFKYAYFIAANLASAWGAPPPFAPIVLPLAISFVTFQKIAYLVDCRRGLVLRHDALDYLFFVSFFPQLIAGPIVHHRPLIAQADPRANPLFAEPAARAAAFVFFAVGLFKKVVLADSLAGYATPVFELARQSDPSGADAWQAMLAYTLQLYFDFSGYTDMAIGLALLFGFRLPINFASPYRAASLIDFWRRWHMTLSAFLRDYLYIPLGGNRGSGLQRHRNLLLTMLLAGLWHGAGWTFIVWGAVHGGLLLVNHAWRALLGRLPVLAAVWRASPRVLHVGLTFGCVALAWVLFRAHDLAAAGRIYAALLPPGHWTPPAWPQWSDPGSLVEAFLAARPPAGGLWIGLGLAIVWAMPNAARLLAYDPTPNAPWRGKPGFAVGLLAGLAFWAALKWMAVQPPTEFLYFNF
jgi:D-alanyl-lipoteichoic acid acyltransferase DltB (MBOAT superfamily)